MDHVTTQGSVEAREKRGRLARKRLGRRAHVYEKMERNFDPIELIEKQNIGRVQELVPIRHARMAESAFAFYRGTAALMAADLGQRPHSGITVQLCGDAHVANFGAFASPERTLLFDVNDFDETLPGPFEWDVKRLVASVVLLARDNGASLQTGRDAAFAAAAAYAESMHQYAGMRDLDIWYSRIAVEDLASVVSGRSWRKEYQKKVNRAQHHDSQRALARLTESVDGELRIRDQPPLIKRIDKEEDLRVVRSFLERYRDTLEESRRCLLDRYRFAGAAFKAVGVGSVGTRCFVGLLIGRDQRDPLFLQVKESGPSVLEAYVGASKYAQSGERVVTGQRLMQAASDIFLGWAQSERGVQFYVRQLWDWKGSVELTSASSRRISTYAGTCARVLARAHARAGDAVAISGYLGTNDSFAEALAQFAVAYAQQADRDYERFSAEIASGRLPTSNLGTR